MTYSHLTGSYTDPRILLLQRANALAAHLGVTIDISSGRRTLAKQRELYENRAKNPYPVAPPTPNDPHVEGVAFDASIGGRPIQEVVSAATLKKFGLEALPGDAVHVQLAGTVGKDAAEIRQMAQEGKFKPEGAAGSSSGGGSSDSGSSGGGVFSALEPVGKGLEALTGISLSGPDLSKSPVPDLADEVLSGVVGDVAKSAEPLMLNIGLVFGGAFLIYYGVALMAGVDEPGLKLLRASKGPAEAAAVA